MKRKWNYHDLFRAAREALRPVDGENADFTARQLVAAATDRTPAQLVADYPLMVFQRDISKTTELVERHLRGEPIAYILGQWDFYDMTLTVTPDVLIPRDDTMAVCDLAIKKALFLNQNPRILDLCAGSGCIGLAIARRVKDAKLTLADVSQAALRVARKNVSDLHLGGRVSCVMADATKPAAPFLGKFDMIVSNPPYVTTAEMQTLDPSVRNYEPHLALWGGDDGLDFYRAIVQNFTPALRKGGYLALEFGMGQESDVCRILEDGGYTVVELRQDNSDITRAVLARYGEEESV